jgi:predicted Zn-dependent peptidase
VAVAYPAAPACDPDRETADVMTSILGGHNSRFYWNIIQAGIAPHVSAFRLDYCDTALVVAFGFCDPDQAGSLRDAMQAEIEAIASRGVTPEEVQRVKNRSRTALATEAEAPYYRLMQLAGEIDVLGRPRNIAQRLAEIDKVTPETIAAYLRKWPLEGDALVVTLGPGGPATAPSKGP